MKTAQYSTFSRVNLLGTRAAGTMVRVTCARIETVADFRNYGYPYYLSYVATIKIFFPCLRDIRSKHEGYAEEVRRCINRREGYVLPVIWDDTVTDLSHHTLPVFLSLMSTAIACTYDSVIVTYAVLYIVGLYQGPRQYLNS